MSDSILTEIVLRMLREIRVYSLPELKKKRYGTPHSDGGYVLSEKLLSEYRDVVGDLFSFGIGDNQDFENAVFSYFRHVRMFDIEQQEFSKRPNMRFFHRAFARQTMRGFPAIEGSVLKFDVEGAEWKVLPRILEERSFFQIIGEFHFFHVPPVPEGSMSPYFTKVSNSFYSTINEELFSCYRETLRVLNQQYYCFHIHANNSLPEVTVGAMTFPPLLEMSWVRKDLIQEKEPKLLDEYLPITGLDVPNKPDRGDYSNTLRFF